MVSKTYRRLAITVIVILVLVAGFLFGLDQFSVLEPEFLPDPEYIAPIVSTRGHLLSSELTEGHNAYDYEIIGEIPGIAEGTSAPEDLLIIIHGLHNTEEKAIYNFENAYLSLESNDFTGEMIGFSWDAHTQYDPWQMTGYSEGRRHAIANGAKLAQFIADYKENCPETRVHVLGYSIGARIALEVLLALDQDPVFQETTCRIDTVFLVGASVDNEEVELGEKYGTAIENRAITFVNYWSEEDNVLGVLYPFKEYDQALGEDDIEHPDRAPCNYVSVDVESELLTFDEDWNVSEKDTGDNHLGCLGLRDEEGILIDDGVMDLIAGYIIDLGETE